MTKRLVDIVASTFGLVAFAPVFAIVAIAIKLDSAGPVFFRQQRVGRFFRPFRIVKFRTMVKEAPLKGSAITSHGDPRITRVGRILRGTKIDELPQLINVFKGEMSLVGPRPEIDEYVQLFRQDFARILQVRPGITDLATVVFRDEEKILARAAEPSEEYRQHILPHKIALATESIARSSFLFDLSVIFRTFLSIVANRSRA
jgi:lipopolysaccharide/colanic/teichoic acid biosynthesis glycosyltransferase